MGDPLVQALDAHFSDLKKCDVAVAVSGGSDSMALFHTINEWSEGYVHALIVDHGLRDGSAEEARIVQSRLSDTEAHILTWDEKPDARIQERAREARYELMADYMLERNLEHLFLGHHMDDQAETFLFRLAKGSGVDGLSCMSERQKQFGITLCRPFLNTRKADLIGYCQKNQLEYVSDPSNESAHFARVRLRKSMTVLSGEGLTVDRLSVAARRFGHVRDALDQVTDMVYKNLVSKKDNDRIEFYINEMLEQPYEIVLRCLMKAASELSDKPQRLQRFESLCDDLFFEKEFRKRTLAGCVFEKKLRVFVITKL